MFYLYNLFVNKQISVAVWMKRWSCYHTRWY